MKELISSINEELCVNGYDHVKIRQRGQYGIDISTENDTYMEHTLLIVLDKCKMFRQSWTSVFLNGEFLGDF